MLVVGSRGRGGFAGLLLGSVSQRCITRRSVPGRRGPRRLPIRTTEGRIVVGVDGSPSSHDALVWAADEAARRDARLDVVNAWSVPEILVPDGVAFNGDADALEQASRCTSWSRWWSSVDDAVDDKPPEIRAALRRRATGAGADRGRTGTRTCSWSVHEAWAASGGCCWARSASSAPTTRRARPWSSTDRTHRPETTHDVRRTPAGGSKGDRACSAPSSCPWTSRPGATGP